MCLGGYDLTIVNEALQDVMQMQWCHAAHCQVEARNIEPGTYQSSFGQQEHACSAAPMAGSQLHRDGIDAGSASS